MRVPSCGPCGRHGLIFVVQDSSVILRKPMSKNNSTGLNVKDKVTKVLLTPAADKCELALLLLTGCLVIT